MRLVGSLFTALILIVTSGTVSWCVEGWEGACEEAYTAWASSLTTLRESMDSLQSKKQESLRSDILDAVSRAHRKLSTARIVQSFLERQNRQIAQETEKCRETADRERFAFDDFKRCVAAGSRRRSNEAQALAALARDRDKIIAELRDLLTEPAYVQYRKERDPFPATASSDPWSQPRASREGQSPWNQRMNYGAPNQFAPRSYYGN